MSVSVYMCIKICIDISVVVDVVAVVGAVIAGHSNLVLWFCQHLNSEFIKLLHKTSIRPVVR